MFLDWTAPQTPDVEPSRPPVGEPCLRINETEDRDK